MAGPLWLRVSLAALMIMIAVGYVVRLCVARASGTDGVHAAMGVAMAGMLVPGISLLPNPVWETAFAASAGWFGWLQVRRPATRPPAISPAGGSPPGNGPVNSSPVNSPVNSSPVNSSPVNSSLGRPAAVAAANPTAVWPCLLLSGRHQEGPNCGRGEGEKPEAGRASAIGAASTTSPALTTSPTLFAPTVSPASSDSPAPSVSPASAEPVNALHDSPVPPLVECVAMVYMLAAAAGGLGPPVIAVLLGLCMVGAVVWRVDGLARTAASSGLGPRLTVLGKIAMSATMGYMLFLMV